MRHAHTVSQVRDAEQVLLDSQPEGTLMQQASVGLAVAIADLLGRVYGARVLLLVGGGHNGGDALHAGAWLARRGASVEAVLLDPDRAHAGGLAALRTAGGRVVDAAAVRPPDVVVDGIVGLGGSPGLRPEARAVLDRVGDAAVVAVDVPSGVGVDSGETPEPHVVADLTVTFGSYKACHLVDPAAQACGTVELVDLGLDLPRSDLVALQEPEVLALVPRPSLDAHKYTRGVVGLRVGSAAYPGAAVLSALGAGCGLVGMVRYVGDAADAVRAAVPEVVVGAGRVQAWVVGSGGGDDAAEALAAAFDDAVPVVLDADALRHLDTPPPVPALLTPHAGELAGMLGVDRDDVEAAPLAHARAAADRFGSAVLLKGRRTLVAEPGGRVYVNTTGTPWLGTAGTGDVLGGLCGALLAAGLEPVLAGAVGAWLAGAAATEIAGAGPLTASDVARGLAPTLRRMLADEAG